MWPADGERDLVLGCEDWGSWALGDLYDALARVMASAGGSVEVARVSLLPPGQTRDMVCVELVTYDTASAEAVRSRLAPGQVPLLDSGPPGGGWWNTELDDVWLRVGVTEQVGVRR